MKNETREKILDSAYNSFYKHGFQGANIATILNDVGINKGSMYHFFKSKKELGLAVVEERIERNLVKKYSKIKSLKELFNTLCSAPKTLAFGCPLNKMSQEMVYIDADFGKLLSATYAKFETLVQHILEKEKIDNASLKAKQIMATYEGALMIYHLNQNEDGFVEVLRALEREL
jgi:TetR/AcrR family transcriptional repressor of nem operon